MPVLPAWNIFGVVMKMQDSIEWMHLFWFLCTGCSMSYPVAMSFVCRVLAYLWKLLSRTLLRDTRLHTDKALLCSYCRVAFLCPSSIRLRGPACWQAWGSSRLARDARHFFCVIDKSSTLANSLHEVCREFSESAAVAAIFKRTKTFIFIHYPFMIRNHCITQLRLNHLLN